MDPGSRFSTPFANFAVNLVSMARVGGGRSATDWLAKVRLLTGVMFSTNGNQNLINPNQTDLLDGMIARLEKANKKAYEQFARADEKISNSEQDSVHPSEQHDHSAAQPTSRARPFFIAVIWLLLTAAACVAALAWESSYGDAAKLTIARWAWVLQKLPEARTTPRDGAPAAPLIAPEIAQPLQRMADDLANLEQQIEQLKASQEQLIRRDAAAAEQLRTSLEQMVRNIAGVAEQGRTSQEQMVRDNAEVAEQFRTSQEQMVRDNARMAEQLRASQEQMARDKARVVGQLNASLAQMARHTLTIRRRSIAKR